MSAPRTAGEALVWCLAKVMLSVAMKHPATRLKGSVSPIRVLSTYLTAATIQNGHAPLARFVEQWAPVQLCAMTHPIVRKVLNALLPVVMSVYRQTVLKSRSPVLGTVTAGKIVATIKAVKIARMERVQRQWMLSKLSWIVISRPAATQRVRIIQNVLKLHRLKVVPVMT